MQFGPWHASCLCRLEGEVTKPVILGNVARWAGLVTVVVLWGLMLGWLFWQLTAD
jgi:hypothetical protein